LNLVGSFFVHYTAGWRMPGLMLIHIGLILLLLGGFFTRISGIEARVQLLEGQGTNTAFSVSDWEISMTTELEAVRDIQAVHLNGLRKRDWFSFEDDSGLVYTVQEVHVNSTGLTRDGLSDAALAALPESPSGFHAIQPEPEAKEPPQNVPAVRLTVEGAQNVQEMILWGNDPRPVGVKRPDGTTEFVRLRRQRFELPMFMELVEFEHKYYPGSRVPRDFRSRVLVHFGEDLERSVDISMNNPMRHNGWTFFQHRFDSTASTEMSEFAVTRNFGRLIPYWATGITSVGLAMHFLQMQWMQLKRRRRKQA
jgi:hypothetical protein